MFVRVAGMAGALAALFVAGSASAQGAKPTDSQIAISPIPRARSISRLRSRL
jgi:hypothetical protein